MPPPGLPPPLIIPSATRHLAEVRRFVAARADAAGLDPRAVHAIQMAVDEACANAIKHAYAGREDGPVTVETREEGSRFRVIVRHEGKPFDPAGYQLLPVAEAARRRKKGGYGVALMRRLVDEVQYRRDGDVSEVHLVKEIA